MTSPKFYSVLTNYGVTAFAQAISHKQPLNIVKMAIGDGNGQPITPQATQQSLAREVYKANLSSIKLDVRNNKQVIFELIIPEDIGGFYIREIGIFDNNDRLVAIANTPESYKPQLADGSGKIQVIRMILLVSSSDSVTLTVDNSMLWAKRTELTPKDLDENSQSIIEENGHSHRLPIATLLKKGITKLFSGLDSDAEDMAATPKAIKTLKGLIDAITRNLGNYIPNSKKSNEVNSNSTDTVATSLAVKTAYDKGVEAKNKADEALGVANTKQSPATTLAGYGITDFVVQSATGDLNTYRTDGIYSFNSRSTTTNAPPNKTGHLIVITGGPGNERWCRQIFRTHYTGEHYERWQTSGSDDNWSDWQRTDITLNNTLTSTATDQALTAAQGKVLKDLIDAVQGIANSNAGAGHLHVIAEITGLQQALNGKANSSHNHAINEITGLLQALNGKADSNHRHGIRDITDLQAVLNGKANSSTTFAGYGITNSQQLNGDLRLKSGDYSSIQLENNSRRYVQIESQPDNSGDIAHIIYKTPIGDNLKRVKIKKQNGTMLLDSDLSSSVTSNSDTEPASVAGVKIAYDKGVEAKNRADEIIASFVGSVAYFATDTAPNGWLKANGAAVSRTTYAELFAKIGTTFGAGNGYSTFNLPDLRGEFLRGLDDGRNVDAGRRLGSTQGDAIRNITGEVWAGIEETQGNGVGAFRIKNFGRRGGSGSHWDDGFTFDASRVVPTADENRPRNVALLACIKY